MLASQLAFSLLLALKLLSGSIGLREDRRDISCAGQEHQGRETLEYPMCLNMYFVVLRTKCIVKPDYVSSRSLDRVWKDTKEKPRQIADALKYFVIAMQNTTP